MIRSKWTENDIPKLKRFIEKIGKDRKLMGRIAGVMESSAVRKINRGVSAWDKLAPVTVAVKGNDKPLQDRGQLMGSINHKYDDENALVGSNVRQAAIQQTGGTIKPKDAQKLAFPAGKEARKLQRRKGFTVRKALEKLKNEGWKIWFTEGAIMGRKGKDQKGKVLFVRKSKVEIPPRPYLFLDDDDFQDIASEIDTRWKEISS